MFAGKRFLIIGGGGFIGTNLANKLCDCNSKPICFGRQEARPTYLNENIDWHFGNFEDVTEHEYIFNNIDYIVHLVGGSIPQSAKRTPAENIIANVLPTLKLLEIAKKNNVKKVIFASSGGTVYGPCDLEALHEDKATNPITDYGVSKLVIEKYLELYRRSNALEYQALRIGNPYGPLQFPNRGQGVIPNIIKKYLSNQPIEIWGDGTIVRDFIYIDDVIDAILKSAFYSGDKRVINIGSGQGTSLIQIIENFKIIFGDNNIKINFIESKPSDVPYNYLDIKRAKSELNWEPKTELSKGLSLTYEWLKCI